MKATLHQIATLTSGLYAQPDIQADTLYLQGVHFDEYGSFDQSVKPQIKADSKIAKHLLKEGDVLFAAKGLNNFAVVYEEMEIGKNAVASSSFIVVRMNAENSRLVLPHYLAWYLTYNPEVKFFHKQLGTTIPSISISKLSELEIGIPPIELQERIVKIQTLRYAERRLVKQLEEKKDYLIKHQLLNAAMQ